MTPITATPVTYGLDASIPRFSVARYQRMIEAGVLTPEDRVELLENYVVLEMPRNPLHDGTIDLVQAALAGVVPAGWLLRVQQTLVLSDSQPEPDLAIVRGNPRTYLTRHPGPADTGLVVEVAESSLVRDRQDKSRIYARAQIPFYWIVNLLDGRIEAFSDPTGPVAVPTYQSVQTLMPGDHVQLILDAQPVASLEVCELLP